MGVIFPVSTPSTITLAPDGYDVTFNEPLPDCADGPAAISAKSRPQTKGADRFIAVSSAPRVDNESSGAMQLLRRTPAVVSRGLRDQRLRRPLISSTSAAGDRSASMISASRGSSRLAS